VLFRSQITWRVADPRKLAALLDFSVDAYGNYRSEDPQAIPNRLVHAAQVLTRAVAEKMQLRDILKGSDKVVSAVLPALRESQETARLGIEILGLSVLSIKPTPDMAKALEAEAREALQRRADEAIYERRNAAVEQERRIKESELQTEIAVEEKKRQVRETQMGADIAVEERRTTLIEKRVANDHKDADSRAYALEAVLKPVRGMDWKTLMALGGGGADPKFMIALAFRELAENAQKIGEVNVSPDLLKSLLASSGK
jgi:regulator of protease activity HflC (stomatin/prohibitin superfamily)